MTANFGDAAKVAEEYVRAWLRGDVETAMGFVADDVVCDAPNGRLEGAEAYRLFLEPFSTSLAQSELVDLLADGERAVTVYVVETPFAKDFRGMEYLVVRDGKIAEAVSVFDLSPAIKAGFAPQG